MQNEKTEILDTLRKHKRELFAKYPISGLALFGSYSRGDETADSDIDILVEIGAVSGFKFLHLNYEIEDLLKRKVDLISKRGLKERFLKAIEPDLIYV